MWYFVHVDHFCLVFADQRSQCLRIKRLIQVKFSRVATLVDVSVLWQLSVAVAKDSDEVGAGHEVCGDFLIRYQRLLRVCYSKWCFRAVVNLCVLPFTVAQSVISGNYQFVPVFILGSSLEFRDIH